MNVLIEPMVDTKGRRALVKKLETRTQVQLAAELDIDQSAISHWARGTSRPEPHHRAALWFLLRIPQASWMTASEKALVDRVRAEAKAPRAAA